MIYLFFPEMKESRKHLSHLLQDAIFPMGKTEKAQQMLQQIRFPICRICCTLCCRRQVQSWPNPPTGLRATTSTPRAPSVRANSQPPRV